jgi:PAS domain S-box-containing protein
LPPTSAAFPGGPDFAPSNDPFFLTMAGTTQDCIRLLDTEGRVQFMNGRGQELFEIEDWRANQGFYWPELLPEVSSGAAHAAVQSALQGATARFRAYCPTAKGAPRWWDNVVAPVFRETGELVGLLAVSHDATTELTALQFLEAVIESVPLVVIVKDPVEGRIELVNRAAEGVYGLARDQLIGKTDYDFFDADRAAHFADLDRQAVQSGGMVDVLADPVQTPHGLHYFRTRKVVIDGPDGPEHIVTILEDVTDQRDAAEALKLGAARAEAANRAKSEFLANMSHEIRTPLHGVISAADLLAATPLDERQREMVEMVRVSGRTLERLLSNILDLSRAETGRLEVVAEPFDLEATVREVASLHASRAWEKRLSFSAEVTPQALGWFIGDATRLKQVLTNLLDNAVKFTERGEVDLRVEPNVEGLCFSITDTGVGFDPSMGDRLFEKFQQADGSLTRRFGGSGLGLAMTQRLVELMGGRIEFDSRPNCGSRFTITLPLMPASSPDPAGEADGAAAEFGCALRILVVDDHPTNRKVMELCLEPLGAEIVEAEDGREAVDTFTSGGFDVVLMDIQMPIMDGLAATRAIREWEQAQAAVRTPIVMVTANTSPEHVRASLAAGADRHTPKPTSAQHLIATIAELLQQARRAGAGAMTFGAAGAAGGS